MKIEIGVWANCSESVFRFITIEPKQIQFILQAIADEITANTDYKPHKKQKVPLLKTAEEYDTQYKEKEKTLKKMYPKSLLSACAGLGDNEAIIKIEKEKGSFRLNIGNNDISPNKTDWIAKVTSLGIKVQEAEFSEELKKVSRDCTCGQTYFQDYKNLIRDKE